MKIIEDLLSTLVEDAPVQEVRTCVFWTAVVSKNCGLASTTVEHIVPHLELPVQAVGNLKEKSARQLAQYVYSNRLLEATIGMAAINSLIDIDEDRCAELNAAEILLNRGAGKKVAIIGHFPFIPKVHKVAKQLWVIEKRPAKGDLPETETGNILPQAKAKVVAITGTAFINHTIESLLQLCPPDTFVMVLGPTTPMSPVLFDYGVDVISGVKVVDPEKVLRCISEGATFKQIKGVKLLTMQKNK